MNESIEEVIGEELVELPKGAKIECPPGLSKEEEKKWRHNEKMKRYLKRKRGTKVLAKNTSQEIRKMDTQEMVQLSKDTRNTAISVLSKALVNLDNDEEALKKANLATLATVFGILFDKTQLMTGMATENIAIQAKIDVNMKADDALELLNKMRAKDSEYNDSKVKVIDV